MTTKYSFKHFKTQRGTLAMHMDARVLPALMLISACILHIYEAKGEEWAEELSLAV